MEVKVLISNIENLKTSTDIKEEKDKETGEVIDRRLITRIQFECEVDPTALSNVHRLMATDTLVHAVIGSPQAVMEVIEKEPAFAVA